MLADVLNGWGGFASSYLERLREDFPKSTVVTYGLGDDEMGKRETMVIHQLSSLGEDPLLSHIWPLTPGHTITEGQASAGCKRNAGNGEPVKTLIPVRAGASSKPSDVGS